MKRLSRKWVGFVSAELGRTSIEYAVWEPATDNSHSITTLTDDGHFVGRCDSRAKEAPLSDQECYDRILKAFRIAKQAKRCPGGTMRIGDKD
jgi:hypothetical protein